MNRILLKEHEVDDSGAARLAGRRAKHIRDVLHSRPGARLRVGILNGPRGHAVVEDMTGDGIVLKCALDEAQPPVPPVDLLLALPRPKVLKRLWAPLASLGVGRIVLTNAVKVERNYFDTHWLEKKYYEPLLIEGLEQSGDTRLPEVTVCRRLKPFIEDKLDGMFPGAKRVLLHPDAGGGGMAELDVSDGEGILLAIGPEGGWTDFEMELLERHGFVRAGMGWRTLRSDTACVAAVALAHAAVGRKSG